MNSAPIGIFDSGIGGLTAIQLGGFKGFGLARKMFL